MIIHALIILNLLFTPLEMDENQISNWIVYTNEEIGISETTINQIIEDRDYKIWIGSSEEGLICQDNGIWTKYDTSNSPLPENNIYSLEVDSANNIWMGMMGSHGGLAKFDGVNWTIWDLTEYGIENPIVMDLEFDSFGKLWMGTYGDGLIKFDGENFTVFNSKSTNLDPNLEEINVIKIDNNGFIWCGTDIRGSMTFDGISEWTYYSSAEYEIDNSIYSINIDYKNNIWFGGVWFISQFDGALYWTKYNYNNGGSWFTEMIIDSNKTILFASWIDGFLQLNYSEGEVWTKLIPYGFAELEDEGCWAICEDNRGNTWIGYNNGYIALYNEEGITSVQEITSIDNNHYKLNQNYPNPFNPKTKISYLIPSKSHVSLKVFDVLGKEVATLVNQEQSIGNYEVEFNASSFVSGIYFYRIQAGDYVSVRKMLLMK